MNVLYITYLGLLEPIPQTQVLPYLYELSKEHNIHLLSFEKKELIQEKRTELLNITNKLQEMKINWTHLRYHKHPLILSSLYDIFIGFCFSVLLILRYRIKIIHARSSVPVALGFLLKQIFSVQLLYDRRGMMGEEDVEQSGWKRGGWLYHFSLWFERKVFQKSDSIVVLTKRMNQELLKTLPPHSPPLIKTIPCCVDLDKFKQHIEPNPLSIYYAHLKEKCVFIYSGSLGTYNLFFEMLDFFRTALKRIPHAHLLILSKDTPNIQKYLQSYTLIPSETITTAQASSENVPLFLSLADCGLIFRRNSPTAIAASPTKLGEYLASGLAIISLSQIGDVTQIVSSYRVGALINDYKEKEYEKSIETLLELFQDKIALKQRCRKVAEEIFPLQEGVKRYSEIYRTLEQLNR